MRRSLVLLVTVLSLGCAAAEDQPIIGGSDSGGSDTSGARDTSTSVTDTGSDAASDTKGDGSLPDATSTDATTEVLVDGATDLGADEGDGGEGGTDAAEVGDGGPCEDGVKGGLETDIDCGGGVCGKCAGGKRCNSGTDCLSGKCLWDGSKNVCVDPAWCTNGAKDFFETDIDCGGSVCVLRCSPGQKCSGNSDCTTSLCLWDGSKNVCVDKTTGCFDGKKDFFETDVDCGGSVCAARCAAGKGCAGNSDCTTGLCLWDGSKNVCVDKTTGCFDSVKSFYETDVDCGGAVCAARCAAGKGCGGNGDCTTSLCLWSGSKNVCVDKTVGCFNASKDFYETDVDCGGSVCAARCAAGKGCSGNSDCTTSLCLWSGSMNVCVDKTVGCFNGSKDFYETDVDCGGSVCAARCTPGQGCGGNGDCTTSLCLWSGSKNVCVDKATGCVNGAKDFYETDIDCGGSVCAARCAKGQKCGGGSDCTSGTCSWTGSANVCG